MSLSKDVGLNDGHIAVEEQNVATAIWEYTAQSSEDFSSIYAQQKVAASPRDLQPDGEFSDHF